MSRTQVVGKKTKKKAAKKASKKSSAKAPQEGTPSEEAAGQSPKPKGVESAAMPSEAGWKKIWERRGRIITLNNQIDDISGKIKAEKENLAALPRMAKHRRDREKLALDIYELENKKGVLKADLHGAQEGMLDLIKQANQGELFDG